MAELAGLQAAKRTSELIPLCHPLGLESVQIDFAFPTDDTVAISARVQVTAKTGVEMEALSATSMALLTIWDMTKQYEKDEEGQYPTTRILDLFIVNKIKAKNE